MGSPLLSLYLYVGFVGVCVVVWFGFLLCMEHLRFVSNGPNSLKFRCYFHFQNEYLSVTFMPEIHQSSEDTTLSP